MAYILEIATNDYNTAYAAFTSGADRIELCSALSEGGLTPSYSVLKKCREDISIPIFPIIRPRRGDFLYNREECSMMKNDIKLCRKLGFEGIVTGLLLKNGDPDLVNLSYLIEAAYPMEVTFHRAFDRCRDPFTAMENLIELGCQRILTSGQASTALLGSKLIQDLIVQANGRMIIMPGSGIQKNNICQLANDTGAHEFHASLRTEVKSSMDYVQPNFKDDIDSYWNSFLLADDIATIKKDLQLLKAGDKA